MISTSQHGAEPGARLATVFAIRIKGDDVEVIFLKAYGGSTPPQTLLTLPRVADPDLRIWHAQRFAEMPPPLGPAPDDSPYHLDVCDPTAHILFHADKGGLEAEAIGAFFTAALGPVVLLRGNGMSLFTDLDHIQVQEALTRLRVRSDISLNVFSAENGIYKQVTEGSAHSCVVVADTKRGRLTAASLIPNRQFYHLRRVHQDEAWALGHVTEIIGAQARLEYSGPADLSHFQQISIEGDDGDGPAFYRLSLEFEQWFWSNAAFFPEHPLQPADDTGIRALEHYTQPIQDFRTDQGDIAVFRHLIECYARLLPPLGIPSRPAIHDYRFKVPVILTGVPKDLEPAIVDKLTPGLKSRGHDRAYIDHYFSLPAHLVSVLDKISRHFNPQGLAATCFDHDNRLREARYDRILIPVVPKPEVNAHDMLEAMETLSWFLTGTFGYSDDEATLLLSPPEIRPN